MGMPSETCGDLARAAKNGTFSGVSSGTGLSLGGEFNASLWGTFVATIQLERSFDGGVTYLPCTDNSGTAQTWSRPMTIVVDEPELGVLYRLNCTAHTSGTVNWRLSR